ncbi:MAG: type II toxin-antitoxin system RelE/ParE family toxin [Candidatus Paceibacterota bacterium]
MSLKYWISQRALQDLDEIWLYTFNKWSDKQADSYYNILVNEIELIAQDFYSGKSRDNIKEGYRSSSIKSHVIFYRISEENVVEVIRILHQMMDLESNLNL